MFRLFVVSTCILPILCGLPSDVVVPLERDINNRLLVERAFANLNETSDIVRSSMRSFLSGNAVITRNQQYIVDGITVALSAGHPGLQPNVSESIMYVHSNQQEFLIIRPAIPLEFSETRNIVYTNMQNGNFIYARSTTTILPSFSSRMRLVLAMHQNSSSSVSWQTFESVMRIMTQAGATLGRRSLVLSLSQPASRDIHFENCYDRLLGILPNIIYDLANSEYGLTTSRLVFYPEDYITRTEEPDICRLMIDAGIQGAALILSGHLITRIGGIHIDLTDHRIGFFDPN